MMSLNLNQNANGRETYHVNLTDTDQVYFVLTRTFSHLNADQALKVLQKADIEVTRENQRGEVNFRFIAKDKDQKPHTVGFVNYYENELDDESSADERKAVIEDLSTALAEITEANIVKPLNQSEADDVVSNL